MNLVGIKIEKDRWVVLYVGIVEQEYYEKKKHMEGRIGSSKSCMRNSELEATTRRRLA